MVRGRCFCGKGGAAVPPAALTATRSHPILSGLHHQSGYDFRKARPAEWLSDGAGAFPLQTRLSAPPCRSSSLFFIELNRGLARLDLPAKFEYSVKLGRPRAPARNRGEVAPLQGNLPGERARCYPFATTRRDGHLFHLRCSRPVPGLRRSPFFGSGDARAGDKRDLSQVRPRVYRKDRCRSRARVGRREETQRPPRGSRKLKIG
jgi:hypothetical protein